uniref:Uncharacterized protein n=1 Tax=viral metagenome TaxID=1070528 RepID=A0A6M3IR88_9ZZZZ
MKVLCLKHEKATMLNDHRLRGFCCYGGCIVSYEDVIDWKGNGTVWDFDWEGKEKGE